MNINRHNYEAFFLLYADEELQAAERQAVELFISQNEDLRIELEMLQAAVLPLEEIIFIDKSFLYKQPVFDTTIHEQLLLKIDNELSLNELQNINNTIATNNAISNEYDLLKRTKLDATEKIIFTEKHLLYIKEKNNVIVFNIARWAAAAVFIGFALFTSIKYINNYKLEKSSNGVAKTNKPSKTTTTNLDTNLAKSTIPDAIVATINNNDKIIKKPTNTSPQKEEKTKNNVAKNNEPAQIDNQEIQLPIVEEKQIPVLANNSIAPQEKILITPNNNIDIARISIPQKTKLAAIDENIIPLENTYAQAVAISSAEKSGNKILYMDEDDIKHSKAGGLFRKIKRFVERTAKIKTGNSIQIAGFEIAAK